MQSINGNGNKQARRDINETNIHVDKYIDKYINNPEYLSKKLPSKIAVVVALLSQALKKLDDRAVIKKRQRPYSIDKKIEYNDLKGYKSIVQKYGNFSKTLDVTYDEADNQEPGLKTSIFRFINLCYDQVKAKCLQGCPDEKDEMVVVKKNADMIMDDVKELVREACVVDKDLKLSIEEFEVCLIIIISHAFIACKILEEPPASDNL